MQRQIETEALVAGDDPVVMSSLERLKSVVLLGGSIRANSLVSAVGLSLLDLPVDVEQSILDRWQDEVEALRIAVGFDRLEIRLMINKAAAVPRAPGNGRPVAIRIEHEPHEYRGTGGLLRDVTEDYGDDDWILAASAAQVLLEPLPALVTALMATGADVALVSHRTGGASGLMLIRCGCLRSISRIGFVDMKEQALPLIAREQAVRVVHFDEPSGVPVGTLAEYICALRADRLRHGRGDRPVMRPVEEWQAGFALVEDTTSVDSTARIHDSVVLCGGRVHKGAVIVRSVVRGGGLNTRSRL